MARKILLADDSVTAQNMGKKILSDAGYEVATVSNGSAALKRVQENPPDLIVLDVYMPGYSGLEVCRRLKESDATAHIPVLLTVGKLEPFKPDEARKARAEAFVVKPFEASELLSMVQRLETDPPKIKEEPKSSRKKKGLAEVFASAAMVDAPDPNAEIDEAGWRDRLSIPHKAHQEPDEAPEVATWGSGSFRDLTPVEIDSPRRDSPFTAEPFVASSIPPTPQDATAEEIAALQAAAAALMGGGDAAVPVAKAAPAEAAPVPAKDVPPSAPETSSTTSEAQAAGAKEPVVPATTPVAEPVAATETKSADAVAKTAMPLVEEAGVIDQSEEPLFAAESAPKAQASSPSAKEEVPEKKLEPVPAAEKEKAPEEGKKETEAIPAAPVAAAPVAKAEEAPEQVKKAEQEVASTPVTPTVVAQEKEEAPEAEKKKTEEVASAPVPPTPVAKEEEAPKTEKKKTEETASAPAPAPIAKEDEAPKKDKKKTAKKEDRRKESEPVPVPMAAASTVAVSQRWVAHPLPLEAIEVSLALDREMAQFYAAAAALEGAAHAPTMVAETSVAVAEPEPLSAPAEASKPAVQESAVPVVAEAALAAAVGAGSEARPETSAATAAAPEKPIAEAEMDRRSAAEMKAAWANWREIRESIVGSNMSQQVVDLAASVAATPEASPEEDSEKSAGDPTSIANIVDSVLAELKPKIVEEIAKKLKKP